MSFLLEFDFECEDAENENDSNLRNEGETDYFFAELKNESGDTLFVEGDAAEFNQMIVAIKIIDYKADNTADGGLCDD